jgi:hypothetical protein
MRNKLLTFLDYDALNLRLIQGLSFRQIREVTGLSTQHIQNLFNREEVVQLLQIRHNEVMQQLKDLTILATEKLRDSLLSENESIRLQAIDKIYRTQGMFKDVVEGKLTAEDVVRKLLEKGPSQTTETAKAKMNEGLEIEEMEAFEEGTLH